MAAAAADTASLETAMKGAQGIGIGLADLVIMVVKHFAA